jgi:hypothetical protein
MLIPFGRIHYADPFAPQNGVVHDEDVFTTVHNVPNGVGKPSSGKVGKN